MTRLALIASLAIVASTPACTPAFAGTVDADRTARAQAAIAEMMKDPESARISPLRPGTEPGWLCGTVNGKNSFGAYAGSTRVIVSPSNVVRLWSGEIGAFGHGYWTNFCE